MSAGVTLAGLTMLAAGQTPAPQKGPGQPPTSPPSKTGAAPADKHVTPEQEKELFRSTDEILRFASEDTGLPIRDKVKRQLTTRAKVEKYVLDKFNDDKDAKRMERSEIVLKKFGLLDRDFQLRPFLVSLLTEQIAGYYDSKTKTVNLLDWIEPESQKPVLAHELTHALQDQHVNLEKWENQTSEDVSRNVTEDNQHLATDEVDSAREAVLEGQAMAVFVDYTLKPAGKSLLTAPDMVQVMKDNMEDSEGSPVMARAPLLLKQSLQFPYVEGLGFEQSLWKDTDAQRAFAGALDRPPGTSYEILNPKAYEHKVKPALLRLPDIHGLLNSGYQPYDVGVMGALDVRMLIELFAGPEASAALTPQWDGGLYFAAQSRKAVTPEQKSSTASVALFYLSQWKTPEAARRFAEIYAEEIGQKYSGVHRDQDAEQDGEQIYRTNEGPALIVLHGTQVFTSESFDLDLARKLEAVVTSAQVTGDELQAAHLQPPMQDLSGSIVRFLGGCGMMKAALPHARPVY